MAVTSTQSKEPASTNNVAVGRYIDTGTVSTSDPTITTGFKPRYVKIVNLAAGGLVSMEWFEGMADASGVKTAANGTISVPVTLGITVSASGFLIGKDTDLLVSSEQLSWIAIG